jgi:cytochrome c-type biogenesis protein CcmE
MDGRRMKFVLIGLGVAGTMVFMLLVAAGKSDSGMAYYVTVKEYVDHGQPTGHFRVNGKVVPGSIDRSRDGRAVRFTMADPGEGPTLAVDYAGVIPDTFVEKADVVVEGRRRPDGVFEATVLLAKCPSKYEAADGQSRAANGTP